MKVIKVQWNKKLNLTNVRLLHKNLAEDLKEALKSRLKIEPHENQKWNIKTHKGPNNH